jgi:hypothetical protein
MKFDNTGDYLIINVNSNPGNLTYYLTGNGFSGGTFTVEESDDGLAWTILHLHTSPPNASYLMFTDIPQTSTRFIRFKYTDKVSGNIGLDDVSIALGSATPAQEINIKQAGISIVSGDTYVVNSPVSTTIAIPFIIENLGTLDTLNISSATLSGVNSADFSLTSFPSYVEASDSSILVLDFTPSTPGTRTAILTINSNDLDEPSYVINLYGIGGALASEPLDQPTNLIFSTVKTYRINANFTPANNSADGYLVLRKKGAAPTSTPVDGNIYQRGDVIGDAQVVSTGSVPSFSPNNIVAGTTYFFKVFTFNGPVGFRNYLTTAPLIGTVTR